MTKLDRYILSSYIRILLLCEAAFTSVYLIVDIFDNMDKYIDRGATFLTVAAIYFYQLPYIFTLVLPVALLISCFFSIGAMARKFEIIAMKISGRSLIRILSPLFLFGLALSVFSIWMTGELVPKTNWIAKKYETQLRRGRNPSEIASGSNITCMGENGYIYWCKRFDAKKNTLSGLHVIRVEGSKLEEVILAESGEWVDGNWILHDGYRRVLSDPPFFEEFKENVFSELTITPKDLGRPMKHRDEMTIAELGEQKNRLTRLGKPVYKELVDYYLRFSFPFSNFIMIFLGAPLSAAYRKSGGWLGFIVSILICFIFFALVRFTQTLGYTDQIHPLASAWSVNLLFFFFGCIFLFRENGR